MKGEKAKQIRNVISQKSHCEYVRKNRSWPGYLVLVKNGFLNKPFFFFLKIMSYFVRIFKIKHTKMYFFPEAELKVGLEMFTLISCR